MKWGGESFEPVTPAVKLKVRLNPCILNADSESTHMT